MDKHIVANHNSRRYRRLELIVAPQPEAREANPAEENNRHTECEQSDGSKPDMAFSNSVNQSVQIHHLLQLNRKLELDRSRA